MKALTYKIFALLFFVTILHNCNSQTTKSTNSESKKSIAEALGMLPNATVNEVIAHYHKLKKEHPNDYSFDDENELNKLGYQYLNNGKTKDAIEIFKLLVAEFPNASNPYDSLAEAYLADNNETLSIKNYEKSLALNPKNINAEDYINKLKYKVYDSTKFHKVYPLKEYQEDLDELGRRLTEVNPNAYRFTSKEDFWKLLESKKSALTNTTTFSDFTWMCSEIIASLNCSHTSMGYFYQERKMIPMELRFPLEVRLINDKLYVSKALSNSDKVKPKDEITSINGVSISELKEKIYPHISSQGYIETYKKNFLNNHSTSIIPYGLGFPETYTVTIKGNKSPVALNPLKSYTNHFNTLPSYLCKKRLCVKYVNDDIAIMTIRSFAYYGSKFPEFKNFIDNSFEAFSNKKIKNLIIDVRGNGGGPSEAGIYLLRYLSTKPFRYFAKAQYNENLERQTPFENVFKGNLFITIDGNGGSTTGHFMSLVKHLNLATIVGEELGSNKLCTGGQKRLRLPNTGIQYSVARNNYETTANSLPIDRGVMPNHFVNQGIEDYTNNIDTVMKFTLEMIKNNNNSE